jgi:hypothetical protein
LFCLEQWLSSGCSAQQVICKYISCRSVLSCFLSECRTRMGEGHADADFLLSTRSPARTDKIVFGDRADDR